MVSYLKNKLARFKGIYICTDLGEIPPDPIPLPMSGKILDKVIVYCKHHQENPTAPDAEKKEDDASTDIEPWDKEYCKVDQATLFELILVCICDNCYFLKYLFTYFLLLGC